MHDVFRLVGGDQRQIAGGAYRRGRAYRTDLNDMVRGCLAIEHPYMADVDQIVTKRYRSATFLGAQMVKPFAFEELLARIRVLLRKPAEIPKTCYKVADLEVHMDTQQVKRGGKDIKLSGKEFALLRYMVQNEGIVLSRDRLEQHLWNFDYAGGSNVIDVYIRYLRKKIDEGYEQKLIHTVRGAGYVLRTES